MRSNTHGAGAAFGLRSLIGSVVLQGLAGLLPPLAGQSAACAQDLGDQRRSGQGESCLRENDCASGLRCAQRVCIDPEQRFLAGPGESCRSRRDCQEALRCIENTCRRRGASTVAVTETPPPPSRGWKVGGAVTGIVVGGLLIPLAVGTAALSNEDDNTPGLALGAVFTLTLAAGAPVAAVGASSGSARPATGLMVTGWISYALALTNAFALLGVGASEADIAYEPFIAATGVLGVTSCAAFAAAALFSDAEVQRNMRSELSLSRNMRPHVSAVWDRSQTAVPTFGFALPF